MDIYTAAQWKADRTFNAAPGQEIAPEIYEEMFNCLPPKQLPADKAAQALHDFDLPIHAGFLMGEPHSSDKGGQLYLAFGMNDYGKGKHFYYLGLSRPAKILHGEYYFMDCLNAFVNGGLFPVKEFADDAEAIQAAADYEATLYKIEYRNGDQVKRTVLYEPRFY